MVLNNSPFTVKRTTTGLGLFTLRLIPAGKRLIEYTGFIITAEEANRSRSKYLFEIDGRRVIDGSSRSNTARYINHSCRPNAEALSSRGRIWIWSRKAIKAGEEITINYGTEYLEEHITPKGCKCKKCVKE